jgi:hypothetical protein
MPRAVDPSLNGGGVPITSSPLNRMATSNDPKFDLAMFLEEILTALPNAIETLLFPAIENMTGIDLSAFLPLLHLMHFDLSTPEAFLNSIAAALESAFTDILSSGSALLSALENIVFGGGPAGPGLPYTLPFTLGASSAVAVFFTNLRDFLSVDFSDPEFNLETAVTAFYQQTLAFLKGIIPQWMLPPTPVGRITGDIPGLVFDTAFSLPPASGATSGEWYWRSDTGHLNPGSAWIQADGMEHELIGNPIAVAAGQPFAPSVWVTWNAATGTASSFQLLAIEYDIDGTRINTVVVASTTPSGTSTFTQVSGTYTPPSTTSMVALAVRVTAGFTAGTLGVDDLAGPATGLLKIIWTEFLQDRIDGTAKLFGIPDTNLNGHIDFQDAWNALFPQWPPLTNAPVHLDGTTVQGFIDAIGSAFHIALHKDPTLLAVTGQTITQAMSYAISTADAADAAYATTIAIANAAGDKQANDADGVEIVDVNTFSGADASALASTDWNNISQTSGVNDVVVRTINSVSMMGIRAAGPGVSPTGQYYYATWVGSYSSTAGFGQLAEVVLGPDGRFADTVVLLHSNSTFTNGAYLKFNVNGATFGTYTQSAGVYTFATPLINWVGSLSVGMRVGCYNSSQSPLDYYITVNGNAVAPHFSDSSSSPVIALDATHVSARILLQRTHINWDPGHPFVSGFYDGFSPTQVLFADYDPPTTVGVVAMRSRASTSTTGMASSATWAQWPSTTLDTNHAIGGGMTVSGAGFQVPSAGPYMWQMRAQLDTTQNGVDFWNCGVFVNGVGPVSVAQGFQPPTGVGASPQNHWVGGSGIVYCNASDVVTPAAIIGGGGGNYVGASDPTTTFFNLARMGA